MKKMFSKEEIQDALSGYAMEDEYYLNDDVKIMFFPCRAYHDAQIWYWDGDSWELLESFKLAKAGEPIDERLHVIATLMSQVEARTRKFRFSQTYKKTVTWREYYDIEAKSLEEALEKVEECDGDLEDCEDAEFVEAEEDVENDIDAYQYRNIDTIYDPDGEEVE